METLYAIVHKDGLILKVVANAEVTKDGILITEIPNSNSQNIPGMGGPEGEEQASTSLISGSAVDLVSIVKFEYDSEAQTISHYYDEADIQKQLSFQMSDNLMWRLNNNGLYWVNNQISETAPIPAPVVEPITEE